CTFHARWRARRLCAREGRGSCRPAQGVAKTPAGSAHAPGRSGTTQTAARDGMVVHEAAREAFRCGACRERPLTPEISVIVVNYNAGQDLARALRSVQA